MIKIVNKHKFNTDSAKRLAYWNNGNEETDAYFVSETLYRTLNNLYFLHVTGGSASVYARRTNRKNAEFGEDIFELSDESAREWVTNKTPDKYRQIFEPTDDEQKSVIISFTIPQNVLKRLEAEKKRRHSSRGEVVVELLDKYLPADE